MAALVSHAEIPGHPGFVAGSDGVVWTCWTNRRRGVKKEFWVWSDTWHQVHVTKPSNGVRYPQIRIGKLYRLHEVILLAFVGPCPSYCEGCRHLDDNPLNNALSNLTWGTEVENAADRKRNGNDNSSVNHSRHGAKIGERHVRKIKQDLALGKSRSAIAREMSVSYKIIAAIDRGLSWTHVTLAESQ